MGDGSVRPCGHLRVHPSQRAHSGTVSVNPSITLQLTNAPNIGYSAFDASGNLWVAQQGNALFEFAASQLAASATGVTPTTTVSINVTGHTVFSLNNIAFDAIGGVWVAEFRGGLYHLTAAQLAAGGAQTATYIGTTDNPAPWGVAFWPHPAGTPAYDRALKPAPATLHTSRDRLVATRPVGR